MMRWLALLAAFGAAAFGQLTLYVVDGTTETPLANNGVFQLPAIEAGDTQSVRLRVRNLGSSITDCSRALRKRAISGLMALGPRMPNQVVIS